MIIWILDKGLCTVTGADWDRLYRCDYDELVSATKSGDEDTFHGALGRLMFRMTFLNFEPHTDTSPTPDIILGRFNSLRDFSLLLELQRLTSTTFRELENDHFTPASSMDLAPEMSDCITTGRCPKCSRVIMTQEGADKGVAGRISCTERLLTTPLTREAYHWGFFDSIIYGLKVGSSAPAPLGWTVKQPTAYAHSKVHPEAKRARKMAERLFLVDVALEANPRMVCKLCHQSWSVGRR